MKIKKNFIPSDSVFSTETAIGLIATARGILMQKNNYFSPRQLKKNLAILDRATMITYQSNASAPMIKCLAEFINHRQCAALAKAEKILVAR